MGPKAVCCPAGLPAEANLLGAQAVAAGVPADCIVIEDQARNSIENALFCLPILQGNRVQHMVLVTSDYHLPRCRLLFEMVLQGTGIELSWAEVILVCYAASISQRCSAIFQQSQHTTTSKLIVYYCSRHHAVSAGYS